MTLLPTDCRKGHRSDTLYTGKQLFLLAYSSVLLRFKTSEEKIIAILLFSYVLVGFLIFKTTETKGCETLDGIFLSVFR